MSEKCIAAMKLKTIFAQQYFLDNLFKSFESHYAGKTVHGLLTKMNTFPK
jgi:hypothetical protein